MSTSLPSSAVAPLQVVELLDEGDLKGCCAAVYEHPAVRWLLGDELHPGGERLTRRAFELIELTSGDRLLDVASGGGATAMLAAGESGCEVVGVDYGAAAVAGANEAAAELGLGGRVNFVEADAEQLPFAADEFDAVICECSLCTFPDKSRAVSEIARVLRPGGRLALADVTVDHERLPERLSGAMATIACVGSALPRSGYRDLLEAGGFELIALESADDDVVAMTAGIKDRLRGARILGLDAMIPLEGGLDEAIELVDLTEAAAADGALGYALFAARLAG
jgi:hypothetical protein